MSKSYHFVFILLFFSCQKEEEKPVVIQKPQKENIIQIEEDKKIPEKAFLTDLSYKNFYKVWNEYSKTNVKDILCKLKTNYQQAQINSVRSSWGGEIASFLLQQHFDSMRTNTIIKHFLLEGHNVQWDASHKTIVFFHDYLKDKSHQLNEFQKLEFLSIYLYIGHFSGGDKSFLHNFRKFGSLKIQQQNIKVEKDYIVTFILNNIIHEHEILKKIIFNNYDTFEVLNDVYNEIFPNFNKLTIEQKRRFHFFISIAEMKEYEAQITHGRNLKRKIHHHLERISLFNCDELK